MRLRWFSVAILILSSGLLVTAANQDCLFLNPKDFMPNLELSRKARSDLTASVSRYVARAVGGRAEAQALDAVTVPRKNFIDDAIFGRMQPAAFVRRLWPPMWSFCGG